MRVHIHRMVVVCDGFVVCKDFELVLIVGLDILVCKDIHERKDFELVLIVGLDILVCKDIHECKDFELVLKCRGVEYHPQQ